MLAYVEMNAFGIIILSFFWHNQQRSGGLSLDDRLFNAILVTTMVEQLMDAGQWALDGVNFTGSFPLQMFCYSVGDAIAPLITCLWLMYCDVRVNMDERGLGFSATGHRGPMGVGVGFWRRPERVQFA